MSGAQESLAIDNLNDAVLDQGIIDSGNPQVLADLFRSPFLFFGSAGTAFPGFTRIEDVNAFLT